MISYTILCYHILYYDIIYYNTLLCVLAVPGFVAYRSKSKGSWYIQALCEQLLKLHNKADLLSILTEVNSVVMSYEKKHAQTTATQYPLPQHTLRKRVYLRTV